MVTSAHVESGEPVGVWGSGSMRHRSHEMLMWDKAASCEWAYW